MACKHADLMMIYAKQAAEMDEPWTLWEWFETGYGWDKCTQHPQWKNCNEYRLKPKTIRIGNYDVPEPMREKPEIGTHYYAVNFACSDGVIMDIWHNKSADNQRLEYGVCHSTRENCIIHAKALFSFSEVK